MASASRRGIVLNHTRRDRTAEGCGLRRRAVQRHRVGRPRLLRQRVPGRSHWWRCLLRRTGLGEPSSKSAPATEGVSGVRFRSFSVEIPGLSDSATLRAYRSHGTRNEREGNGRLATPVGKV